MSVVEYVLLIALSFIVLGLITYSLIPLIGYSNMNYYIGGAVKYVYNTTGNVTNIVISNTRGREVKVDVYFYMNESSYTDICPLGVLESSLGYSRLLENSRLHGIVIKSYETITIKCYINASKVLVVEYGLIPSEKTVYASVGNPNTIVVTNTSFSLRLPWGPSYLFYRLPVTLVATKTYSVAYLKIKLYWPYMYGFLADFVEKHVRPDLNDMVLVDLNGTLYPTNASWTDNGIEVLAEVHDITPGVHYFFLYFGNPWLDHPVMPINTTVTTPTITCSQYGTVTYNTITFTTLVVGYLIPEANFLLDDPTLHHKFNYTNDSLVFSYWVNSVAYGYYNVIDNIITKLEEAAFPVGTANASKLGYTRYYNKYPRTDLGLAPWGTITVIELPYINPPRELSTSFPGKISIAVDDGVSVYLYHHNTTFRLVTPILEELSSTNSPAFFNYIKSFQVNGSENNYLIILSQNGLLSGSGPGFLDVKILLQYVEQAYTSAPPVEEFLRLRTGRIDVEITGLLTDQFNYPVPVNITGRTDIAWEFFDPSTVYCLDSTGKPAYIYIEKTPTDNTIIWIRVNYLPAGSSVKYTCYYGGINKYPSYQDPSRVFLFFDDFSLNPKNNPLKWTIYWNTRGRDIEYLQDEEAIRLWGPSSAVVMIAQVNDFNVQHFCMKIHAYVGSNTEGIDMFFSRDTSTYSSREPLDYGRLGMAVWDYLANQLYVVEGYGVEIDAKKSGSEPITSASPHIALTEDDPSTSIHYALKYVSFTNSYHSYEVCVDYPTLKINYDGRELYKDTPKPFLSNPPTRGTVGLSLSTNTFSFNYRNYIEVSLVFIRPWYGDPEVSVTGYPPPG